MLYCPRSLKTNSQNFQNVVFIKHESTLLQILRILPMPILYYLFKSVLQKYWRNEWIPCLVKLDFKRLRFRCWKLSKNGKIAERRYFDSFQDRNIGRWKYNLITHTKFRSQFVKPFLSYKLFRVIKMSRVFG